MFGNLFGGNRAKDGEKEALARKARSIARLRKEGVPTIDHLPVIENSTQFEPRSKEEIGGRAIATCLCAVKGEGLEQEIIKSLVAKFDAESFLSPKEREFIEDPEPAQVERVQFCWRYECYWVFLWALGYVPKLGRPEGICDVKTAVSILRDLGRRRFIEEAQVRPIGEVLDEADLIYRYDWACVDARVNGGGRPAGLDPGVVVERHRALNWLVRYCDADWDEVTTDT